ncbi:hypothetical protein IBE48_04855 [Francisella philomiragia]|uniref:Lipoprotein n=1 Tax=Francisella philomiragia TaxID=28110 RepID=A0AAW3DB05_9GAMM|nr:hypothetical protein [Francisella philomiragia]KFJ42725.1 putative lipoprotein [Francisella philomiragia]MBK2254025.1 hypothetical protein [Francisella philomiragia]MBK2272337.1 hypothetical protein [Francisella philomiragia]MBK2276179.1 hypothetical protein [Francisella philomiragia]MBK2280126.1 hypothetical protein [Francisella philomiragia]
MKGFKYAALSILVGVGLAGCASSEANLKMATAKQIGNVVSDDVSVSNIDRGATTVNWQAKANDTNYKCEADDMVRSVNCVKAK